MKKTFDLSSNDQFEESMAMTREHWPHWIAKENPLEEVSPAHQFCLDRFGPCASLVEWDKSKVQAAERVTLDTEFAWANTGRRFCFRDADQAFEFKLAWG